MSLKEVTEKQMKTMQVETESSISRNHIATASALASKSDASEQFRMIIKQFQADIKHLWQSCAVLKRNLYCLPFHISEVAGV